MTGPAEWARQVLAEYDAGGFSPRELRGWAPRLADVLREILVALDAAVAAIAEVDADARHTLVLAQALGEIAVVDPELGPLVRLWLAGNLPYVTTNVLTSRLYALPERLDDDRDVVLVAVRNREDRHAAQAASDGAL